MAFSRFLRRTVLGGLAVGACAAQVSAVEPVVVYPRRTATAPAMPAAPSPFDPVIPEYREAVALVVKNSTLSVKATDDEFVAHAKVYDWLLDHPDRVSLAWQRMNVPCVEITDVGNGWFHWADEHGSELKWRVVGRSADSIIWYATGKMKPGSVIPSAPVKAVAVLKAPRQVADERIGAVTLEPSVTVYMQTESRAASALLRMIGPAAPRMAEQGAEQFLLFFSGPARHIHKHPEKAPALLAPAAKGK
ncbi:hypothetical protein [Fimbriiglobus ruber]|uniref:Uncharacterized protein n=1 Tax=Fimbriiglobus ruber TaxID=1908690 RepID=A0A225DFU7_9BACT|nr:hypothetical protein [Fimbriiglobus ruber]OWK38514.1 hypothetical protein FRUB_07634 [Fimbriiglobus ruber]